MNESNYDEVCTLILSIDLLLYTFNHSTTWPKIGPMFILYPTENKHLGPCKKHLNLFFVHSNYSNKCKFEKKYISVIRKYIQFMRWVGTVDMGQTSLDTSVVVRLT